jgi:hypothetical protein
VSTSGVGAEAFPGAELVVRRRLEGRSDGSVGSGVTDEATRSEATLGV